MYCYGKAAFPTNEMWSQILHVSYIKERVGNPAFQPVTCTFLSLIRVGAHFLMIDVIHAELSRCPIFRQQPVKMSHLSAGRL